MTLKYNSTGERIELPNKIFTRVSIPKVCLQVTCTLYTSIILENHIEFFKHKI